jgi:hypothetical protein
MKQCAVCGGKFKPRAVTHRCWSWQCSDENRLRHNRKQTRTQYRKDGEGIADRHDADLRRACRKGDALLREALIAGGYDHLVGSPAEVEAA